MGIQLHTGDSGLNRHIQVIRADPQDLVHALQINHDATQVRNDVPLQRGACPIRHHRRLVGSADPHDLYDIFGTFWKNYRIGPVRMVPGLILGVVITNPGNRR